MIVYGLWIPWDENHHPNTTIWDIFFLVTFSKHLTCKCKLGDVQIQLDKLLCGKRTGFAMSVPFLRGFEHLKGSAMMIIHLFLWCLRGTYSKPWLDVCYLAWWLAAIAPLKIPICFRGNRPTFRGLLTVSFREGKCRPCDEIMTEKSQSGLGEYACLPVQV